MKTCAAVSQTKTRADISCTPGVKGTNPPLEDPICSQMLLHRLSQYVLPPTGNMDNSLV